MINSDIKRLVVFGDSNTFGYGLSDAINNSVPSKLAWPNIVANHYNLQLCNKAIGGAGNDSILRNIHDYFFGPCTLDNRKKFTDERFTTTYSLGDVAIIGLSVANRFEFHYQDNHYYSFLPSRPDSYNIGPIKELFSSYLRLFSSISDEYLLHKVLQDIHSIKCIFEHYKIPYLIFHALPPIPKQINIKWNSVDSFFSDKLTVAKNNVDSKFWIKDIMFSTIIEKCGEEKLLPCKHFNIDGHIFWANFLINKIDSINLIKSVI